MRLFDKLFIMALILFSGFASYAKVDFSEMIESNNKEQIQIHMNMQKSVNGYEKQVQQEHSKQKEFFVEDKIDEVSVVSQSNDFTKFKKEKTAFQPSSKEQKRRISQEFKDIY